MPLTPAEKQRRYRQKRDSDRLRREDYLKKEKDKYERRKESGATSIYSLSDNAKMHKRKHWREAQRKCRSKKSNAPTTPDPKVCKDPTSTEKKKMKNRYTAKIKALREQMHVKEKLVNEYRKRLQRVSEVNWSSPRVKRKEIIKDKKKVSDMLLCHLAFISDLKTQYKTGTSFEERRKIRRLLRGALVKKYKMKTYTAKSIGFGTTISMRKRKEKGRSRGLNRLGPSIRLFYLRDDNSKILPGSKQTVTLKKVKKQKRILLGSLKNLYRKFCNERPDLKISYALFCKLRPFWVKQATEAERQICACKHHENMNLLTKSLSKAGLVRTGNTNEIVKGLVCSPESIQCMYGVCENCNSNMLSIKDLNPGQLKWEQWIDVKEERDIKRGDEIKKQTVNITRKEEQTGPASDLAGKFNAQLPRYKRHIFNVKNQQKYYQDLKTGLNNDECLIHVGFAENYVGKMHQEISKMHYGASAQQVSIHTGVYYIGQSSVPHTFASVSDSLQHGPAAIWEHISPVLTEIKSKYPNVTTTQYRQKANFYLFRTQVKSRGFKNATWNYFASGHGKGVPDAVGATLKRTADRLVRQGADIPDAVTFYHKLLGESLRVQLYFVTAKGIDAAALSLKGKN